MSELMLRRTQAKQVAPVYEEFFKRWPTLQQFLKSDESELARVLKPLGLQWRVQNVLQIKTILSDLGQVPRQYEDLRSLPGVGDYVASAILCFSGQEARPLIDTNTVRLIGRYFGLRVHAGTRRLKSFHELSKTLVPTDVALASSYHYGLLDLAAAVCRPVNPRCCECPVALKCRTLQLEGASLSNQELGE